MVIPRVINHFTHLKFLSHKESLQVYDDTYAVLDRSHLLESMSLELRGEKRNYKSVAKEISKPPFFGS